MKIAIVSYFHPESTICLARHLGKAGHEIHYYYLTEWNTQTTPGFEFRGARRWPGSIIPLNSRNAPVLDAYLQGSVQAHIARLARFGRTMAPLNRFLARRFGRHLARQGYDLVNLIGQAPDLKLVHQELEGTPVVHNLHEVAEHYAGQEMYGSLIEHLLSRRIPLVVHSRTSEQRIKERPSCDPATIHRIPFGLFESYLPFAPEPAAEDGRKNFLFYGYILPYKGLDTFVDAVERLGDTLPEATFTIAGGGHVPALERAARNPRFRIVNRHLDNSEIARFNREAYAVVCPYRSASQSGIITTTFLFGKPIIASDVGGFSEFIENGTSGMLIPADDPDALAQAIGRLCSDPGLHARLSEGVRAFGTGPETSWDSIAERTLKLYERTIASRNGAVA